MTPPYLLALDAGGGAGRCLLVDVESGRPTVAVRPWAHLPTAGGWGWDFDAERNWRLLTEAAREALARAGPGGVLGLAVTSMRHGLVVLDDKGQVLLAAPNRDARAAAEAMAWAQDEGPALYERTGHWPLPIFAAARLRWMAAHMPEAFARAAVALSISDWFAYRLCGELASDPSQAGETLLLDLQARGWAFDLVDHFDLPRPLLPPLRQPGALLGRLTAAAAAELGLPAGLPVAVGGADTQCGLLGVGAVAPGELAAIAGTTAPVQMVVDRPLIDSYKHLWTGLHVVPGRWVVESNAGNMGEALEWFARMLYPESPRPVARLLAEAAQSEPGAGGLFSTLGAQLFNASQMGVPVGNISLSPLGAAGRRSDLARAVVEGMVYALRANVEQIAGLAGAPTAVKLAGGMARSAAWCRMVGAVLGRPVEVSQTPESTALGAAICAGVGAGLFPDLAAGAAQLARTRTLEPDTAAVEAYRDLYADWQRLCRCQDPAAEMAADLLLQQISERPAAPVGAPPVGFRPRFLVTAQMDERGLAGLRELGEVEYASYREALRVLTGDDLVEALAGVHVLVTEVDMVDLEALQQLPDLRIIVSCRGNAVNVDTAACTALGIPVLNAPGRNAAAVADLTLAFMLMLGRRLAPANAFLRQPGGEAGDMGRMGQAFDLFLGVELWGKTVGLVGLGAVGREVAGRLRPFGVRLLVHDPFIQAEDAARLDAELVEVDQLLAESDFVSLHAAVTDETRGMIGAAALARMKPGAFLINTARAALMDEEALLEHLRSGRLGGAALDVFSVEPPAAGHPLLALSNVLATPHVGGNTVEVAVHQGEIILADIRRMLAGERPRFVLNPTTLAGFTWEGPRQPVGAAALEELAGRPGPAVSDLHQEPPAAPGSAAEPTREETIVKEVPVATIPAGGDLKAQVLRVLEAFVALARSDAALRSFAAKRKVITHYTLSDMGLEFYVGFEEGVVTAGLGAPARPAEVRMKATAATLDGILTGQLSGNKAAMSGKLSFSGDVRVAMGIQRVQGDLVRVYSAAREAAGGLDPAALARAGLPPSLAGAPAEPTVEDPRPELLQVVQELYGMQLITATGGNVSVRVPGKDEAWITPSQFFKGNLQPEVLVRIDMEGNALDPAARAPSSERLLHSEIYKVRPEVQAVVHTHAPYATILGLSGRPFLPVTTDAAFFRELPRVPFIMPGTRELAQAVVQAMGRNPAAIMQNHGLVVAASSLRRASNLTEAIERTAQLILGCYAVGRKPPTLPKDIVQQLQELGEMMA